MTRLRISSLQFTAALPAEQDRGLVGYVTFLLQGCLQIDGVTVRRKLAGGFTLSWPVRTDGAGRRHALVYPIDDHTRRALEAAVLVEVERVSGLVAAAIPAAGRQALEAGGC